MAGLIVNFDDCRVAVCAAGLQVVEILWSELRGLISVENQPRKRLVCNGALPQF